MVEVRTTTAVPQNVIQRDNSTISLSQNLGASLRGVYRDFVLMMWGCTATAEVDQQQQQQ